MLSCGPPLLDSLLKTLVVLGCSRGFSYLMINLKSLEEKTVIFDSYGTFNSRKKHKRQKY
jgi:hypothetical protein